jgi:uncharacterized protein (TIGR03000 family)
LTGIPNSEEDSMYSVVLMASMMTTPVTPDGLFHKKSSGCCGEQTSCGCCGAAPTCCAPAPSCGCCGESHSRKHRHSSSCGCCGVQTCCAPAPTCGCCGGGMMMAPPAAPAMPKPETAPTPAKTMLDPNAATIVVTGAKDAKITIGGLVSANTGDVRTMVSPALDAGQVYHYDLTAEAVRDGQTVKVTQAVTVRPGETTNVTLDFGVGAVVMK